MSDSVAGSAADGSFAARRVVRVMTLTLEGAALILFLLDVGAATAQMPLFPAWWTAGAIAALLIPAVACLVVGAWVRPRVLKILCGAQAIGFLGVLVTAPLALGGHRIAVGSGIPWPVELSVIAGSAAAVAWRAAGALAYGIALQAAVFVLVFVAPAAPQPGSALGDAVFGLFFVTLFTCLALALRRAGTVLDEAVAAAVADARTAAAAEATRSTRRRIASLIHDRVIVALLAYADPSVSAAIAVTEARAAIGAIQDFERMRPSTDRDPTEFAWQLQALTTELDPDAVFDYVVTSGSAVPAAVADAVAEAVAEALRNSVRHAGPAGMVARALRVTASGDTVEVVVLDDGAGFRPDAVPDTRLGIRHGIVGRMDVIPGASARVVSAPGAGTIVAVQWRRS